MGLAASQSRFLLLTARQNSISSQVMALTNQQMSLQRQQSILAQDYNRKQNAQSITYEDAPLDYASLMTPSTTGQNSMFTSSSGEVMLTNALASSYGLKGSQGTAQDFLKKYATADDFVRAVSGDKNYGIETAEVDKTTDTTKPTYSTSAFRYDDSIMNDAVVSVSAASPLLLGGYVGGGEEDAEAGGTQQAQEVPTLEYAMGTQQDTVNSLACINTLDKYQLTEPNVHAVTNEFVTNACTTMADTMIDNFGCTDALNQALSYAIEMTQKKYAESQVYTTGANILFCAQIASGQVDLNNVDNLKKVKDSLTPGMESFYSGKSREELQSLGLNATDIDTFLTRNEYTDHAIKVYAQNTAASVPLNSVGILVSKGEYYKTTTTGQSIQDGTTQTSTSVTHLDGKDVYVNTAQLTATFLNFFDAEMNRLLGTAEGDYYGATIEQMALNSVDMIALRESLQTNGLGKGLLSQTDGQYGALAFDQTIAGTDYTINPGQSIILQGVDDTYYKGRKDGVSLSELVNGTRTTEIPKNLIQAARAVLGIENKGGELWGSLYQPEGISNDGVWSVLGNEAMEEYQQYGTITMKDPSTNLSYTMNVDKYAKDLPTYYVYYDDQVSNKWVTVGSTLQVSTYLASKTWEWTGTEHYWYTPDGATVGRQGTRSLGHYVNCYTTITNTFMGNKVNSSAWVVKQSYIPDLDSNGACKRTSYTNGSIYTNGSWTIGALYRNKSIAINVYDTVSVYSGINSATPSFPSSGPIITTINGHVYTATLTAYDQWSQNITVKDMKVSSPYEDGRVAVVDREDFPVPEATYSETTLIQKNATIEGGTSVTICANAGDYIRFSVAGGMVEWALNQKDLSVTAEGNKSYVVTNHSAAPQEISYYMSVKGGTDEAYLAANITSGGGASVSGRIGDQNLLSSTFSTAASGIFGEKNLAGQDFDNLAHGSEYVAAKSKAAGGCSQNEAQFLKSIYNAIATGGWKVDGKINNQSYLSQQVLSGNVLLCKFNNSASWNAIQIGDTNNGLTVKDDKETQEKAKKEYEAQVSIIETKNTFLQSQIDTLNTMAESLGNEKDSLQTIMDKEQEKFILFG